jgi:hypothetical protein
MDRPLMVTEACSEDGAEREFELRDATRSSRGAKGDHRIDRRICRLTTTVTSVEKPWRDE